MLCFRLASPDQNNVPKVNANVGDDGRPPELNPQPYLKVKTSTDLIFSRQNNRESTITVTVKKSDGTPAEGLNVSFRCNSTYPGTEVVGRFGSSSAVTDKEGTATTLWTCRGDQAVEGLNIWNAMRFFFLVYVTASSSVDGRLVQDTVSIRIQKEACHYSCGS